MKYEEKSRDLRATLANWCEARMDQVSSQYEFKLLAVRKRMASEGIWSVPPDL